MYENQPSVAPTNKTLIAAMATILSYHMAQAAIPAEVMGAYAVVIHSVVAALFGTGAAWPFGDRWGNPSESNWLP